MNWILPESDRYFAPFVSSGFQLDHLEAAFKHVRKWDVAVDLGAHVGFWTREMAAKFGYVHAWEPAEDTFACLLANMQDYPNVILKSCAAGAHKGKCRVNDDPQRGGNTGARFIRPDGDCEVHALDELDLLQCDLLKVDVEGYEYMVLQGARETIKRCKPVVIMETDKRFARARYSVPDDAAEKYILAQGYRVAEHMRPDKVFTPAS